ncbi:MAG TPA: hypothetical protein VKV04_19115 [Verrucomicrobiae bacterium]|nr:hypothetical protein [Verrucomicrobiae bacterium]
MKSTVIIKGIKTKQGPTSLTKRIVSAILGREGLTPAQRAKLAEMDKDYEELVRERDGRTDKREKSLKQN